MANALSIDDTPQTLSDVRSEPQPTLKHSWSTQPQLNSPPNPDDIHVHIPNGTPPPPPGELLPDVLMAEDPSFHGLDGLNGQHESPDSDASPTVTSNGVNGHSHSADKPLSKRELDQEPFVSFPSTVEPASLANVARTVSESVDEGMPPAKRARKFSDADKASLNHTNGSSTPSAPLATLSTLQYRFIASTVRQLKKSKDAAPFLLPVDPVALNIPHYPSVIKHPMDFGTIEHKIAASNPAKPDPNPSHPRYRTADEFVADVHLIFDNCSRFNGPDHLVTQMGKRVEAVFEKQIKHMPPNEEPKALPAPKKHVSPAPPPPPPVVPVQPPPQPKKAAAPRRSSTAANAMPTIRRSESEVNMRPKREIHPPAPKDLPYADVPKKTRPKKGKDDGTQEQLKFCAKLLTEMFRKQHWAMASPFYEPVDWVKLDIPTYPKIVKKPMDLASIKKKLDSREYTDATKFFSDFKLMIRNCFAFNPAGTPVNNAGVALQAFFDDKWQQLPPLKDAVSDEEDEDDEDSDDESVAVLRSQLEQVKQNLALLSKKPKKKQLKHGATAASAGMTKPKSSKKNKGKARAGLDDEILTFDQKKDLSETIQTLDGAKLERVIQIIHEGVPEIRDSTEEIELDIDSLPQTVLLKLYNYVLRPIRPKTTHPARPGGGRHASGTGTGGVKRKSMDEEAEAERIRLLEERIRLFDEEQAAMAGGGGSARSSDSSDSDSSGSDSE